MAGAGKLDWRLIFGGYAGGCWGGPTVSFHIGRDESFASCTAQGMIVPLDRRLLDRVLSGIARILCFLADHRF